MDGLVLQFDVFFYTDRHALRMVVRVRSYEEVQLSNSCSQLAYHQFYFQCFLRGQNSIKYLRSVPGPKTVQLAATIVSQTSEQREWRHRLGRASIFHPLFRRDSTFVYAVLHAIYNVHLSTKNKGRDFKQK